MIGKTVTTPFRRYSASRRKGNVIRPGVTIVLVLLIVLTISSAGCINMIKKSTTGRNTTENTGTMPVQENSTPPAGTLQFSPTQVQQSGTLIIPQKSSLVTEFTPVATPDPYVAPKGVRINSTPTYAFLYRQPEFTKTYTLRGNTVGLFVSVAQGPLYIRYTVDPKYDCLKDPDSCRGTMEVPVNRPYMTITVRDNETHDIVAQNGYAREFSSDTGNYQFVVTNSGISGSDTHSSGTTYNPGPRYVAVYQEGLFEITMTGNYLDVNLSIITGSSPNPLDAIEKTSVGTPVTGATPTQQLPPWIVHPNGVP